jgi:hypothetical protein
MRVCVYVNVFVCVKKSVNVGAVRVREWVSGSPSLQRFPFGSYFCSRVCRRVSVWVCALSVAYVTRTRLDSRFARVISR